MNVVDSSGWLEYFSEGANADFFRPAIEDHSASVVPTICLFEVFKRLHQIHGEDAANHALGVMLLGNPLELTVDLALRAAEISSKFKLSLADSIILATAWASESVLWTQDAHFEGIPGVKYVKK